MSEYANNIQKIEDLWKKRIELREEGVGRMSEEHAYAYESGYLDGYSARESEIVRCRDCKHFTPKGTHKFENGKVNADYCTYVRSWMLQITPEGFCAWGERWEP